jgi:hypothetical protein
MCVVEKATTVLFIYKSPKYETLELKLHAEGTNQFWVWNGGH